MLDPVIDQELRRRVERQQWIFRVCTAAVTALFAAYHFRYGDRSDWCGLIFALLFYIYFEYKHQRMRRRETSAVPR